MSLPIGTIEPTKVCLSGGDITATADLGAVLNNTLANIIKQLESLMDHTENVFSDLNRETEIVSERANSLQMRVNLLANKVTRLDGTVETVPLQDVQRIKAFKSSSKFDQLCFSKETMPASLLETYMVRNYSKEPEEGFC